MSELLNLQQLENALTELDDWSVVDGSMMREFVFSNFEEAFAFMTQVALHAERLNHHPDWSNNYNIVIIRLSSHEVNGITDTDLELARAISDTYESLVR